MTNKQLIVIVASVTVLSLALAWLIEETQVRQFRAGLEQWWEEKNGTNRG